MKLKELPDLKQKIYTERISIAVSRDTKEKTRIPQKKIQKRYLGNDQKFLGKNTKIYQHSGRSGNEQKPFFRC